MKLYKLTDSQGKALNGFPWSKRRSLSLRSIPHPETCTRYVIHAYRGINQALLLNPAHANFDPPRLWLSEGDVVVDDGDKVGCFTLKILKELDLPKWYVSIDYRKEVTMRFVNLCTQYYENIRNKSLWYSTYFYFLQRNLIDPIWKAAAHAILDVYLDIGGTLDLKKLADQAVNDVLSQRVKEKEKE